MGLASPCGMWDDKWPDIQILAKIGGEMMVVENMGPGLQQTLNFCTAPSCRCRTTAPGPAMCKEGEFFYELLQSITAYPALR